MRCWSATLPLYTTTQRAWAAAVSVSTSKRTLVLVTRPITGPTVIRGNKDIVMLAMSGVEMVVLFRFVQTMIDK